MSAHGRGPEVVVFGNLLVDDVVYGDGRTRMAQPGGATLYVALAARLWGVSTGIVSRVGEDYPRQVLAELEARGIDLAGVRPLEGPGLRTWLLDEGDRRQVVHRLAGPSHADVSPTLDDLPEGWRPRVAHLAPMPWVVQRELVASLGRLAGTLVALDPYELLTRDRLGDWRAFLRGADCLFLSQDEMLIDGALDEPRPVLRELASGRLARIFFKRGARGGLAYDALASTFQTWTGRAEAVVDTTGAGDAFAGGTLAGLALGDGLDRAIARGVVSASFALESEGAGGLFTATTSRALQRLERW